MILQIEEVVETLDKNSKSQDFNQAVTVFITFEHTGTDKTKVSNENWEEKKPIGFRK